MLHVKGPSVDLLTSSLLGYPDRPVACSAISRALTQEMLSHFEPYDLISFASHAYFSCHDFARCGARQPISSSVDFSHTVVAHDH